MLEKLIIFLVIFIMCFLGNIFAPIDVFYLKSLNIPSFIMDISWISIIWIIFYLVFSFNVIKYFYDNDFRYLVLINYLFMQCFNISLYYFHNLFFSLTSLFIMSISSLFMYFKVKKIDINKSLLLYFLWNGYLFISILIIYFLN